MRIIVRGWKRGKKQFEEAHDITDESGLAEMAERHAFTLGPDTPHMIEIEFPDEPDPLRRFYRFGTDPSMMTLPIAFDPTKIH